MHIGMWLCNKLKIFIYGYVVKETGQCKIVCHGRSGAKNTLIKKEIVLINILKKLWVFLTGDAKKNISFRFYRD